MQIYSSAECEREECPGPNFSDCHGMRAWSESVGEPKGSIPISFARIMSGWLRAIFEERRWKERADTSDEMFERTILKISSFV